MNADQDFTLNLPLIIRNKGVISIQLLIVQLLGELSLLFTNAHDPTEDKPQGNRQHHHDTSWANCHQGLDDEPRVEVDPIKRTYTPRRRICEQFTM